MKIIHTSDWHLGKFSFEVSRLPDQKKFIFEYFLPLCDEEKPDAILLSGDIFDRRVAPPQAIQLFDQFIVEVCENRGIKLLTITGNHDGGERFALASSLLHKQGFHVETRPAAEISRVETEQADIYLLPYIDPPTARDLFPDTEISGFTEAYQIFIEQIKNKINPEKINILMAHCFVGGAAVSDSESTLYVGGSGEVAGGIFADFDFVALGHLHTYQNIGENLTYSGAPLKYSFDEEKKDKFVVILELEKGKITKRAVPVTGQRGMRTLRGTFEEILQNAEFDESPDDYIEAVYSGPPVFEPMARLREAYKNVLSLRREESEAAGGESGRMELRAGIKRGRVSDEEIFTEFLRQICGVEANNEDIEIFREACEL